MIGCRRGAYADRRNAYRYRPGPICRPARCVSRPAPVSILTRSAEESEFVPSHLHLGEEVSRHVNCGCFQVLPGRLRRRCLMKLLTSVLSVVFAMALPGLAVGQEKD